MKKYNFGILGLGRISHKFVQALKFLNFDVFGVASRDIEKAINYKEQYSAARAYGSYEEMVQDKDIDVVYISTPHGRHFKDIMLCLSYGKHVICEKPLTLNAEEAKAAFAYAKEKNVLLMEAMWTRFIPVLNKIRFVIDSGIYGKIKMIKADFCMKADPSISRLFDPNLGGGALLDIGIYPITFANMLLGKPTDISAQAILSNERIDLATSCIFKYDDALAILNCSNLYKGQHIALVYLEKAYMEITRFFGPTTVYVFDYDHNIIDEYEIPLMYNGFEYQILGFVDSLYQGKILNDVVSDEVTISILEQMDEVRKLCGIIYPNEMKKSENNEENK